MISVSTTKSNSSWLDRLRSSRGFPTGDEPDLHRFISSSSSGSVPTSESTRSESTQSQTRAKVAVRESDEQWFGEVSNVLCELFNMGEENNTSRSFSKKKSFRKQANPRYYHSDLCSSDDLRRDNGFASSGDNSLNDNKRENQTPHVDVEARDQDMDLKAYSRSEVMVVDTSLRDWKFDGWVFRKNDEWKIKEKKCKSIGKKRKLNDEMNKMMNKDDKCFLSLNKGQSQNDRKEVPFKEVPSVQRKAPQNRFPCPRPPEKPGNEGSSVILLKSIPLNSSNIATKLGKSSRKRPQKKMKIV